MKMGTIRSPWRYDVDAYRPLQSARVRLAAMLYEVSWGVLAECKALRAMLPAVLDALHAPRRPQRAGAAA